jgi:hypothetical protein
MRYLKEYNRKEEIPAGLPKLNIVCDFDDAPPELIPPTNHKAYVYYGLDECDINYADGVTLKWTDKETEINVGGFGVKFSKPPKA